MESQVCGCRGLWIWGDNFICEYYINIFSMITMGKMNIVLTDDQEKRFRKTVYENKGYKKGNISIAIEEAIDLWIEREEKEAEKKGKSKNE